MRTALTIPDYHLLECGSKRIKSIRVQNVTLPLYPLYPLFLLSSFPPLFLLCSSFGQNYFEGTCKCAFTSTQSSHPLTSPKTLRKISEMGVCIITASFSEGTFFISRHRDDASGRQRAAADWRDHAIAGRHGGSGERRRKRQRLVEHEVCVTLDE
jgi:hypothetical protein